MLHNFFFYNQKLQTWQRLQKVHCNIKYITNLRQKVFGLIDINQLFNVNQLYNVNQFYNVNSIRYIPYCICCTIQYTIVDNKVDI